MKKLSKLNKLSHSRYKTLKTCPYQFYLQYILQKLQGPSHPSALYGSVVQKIYEEWFNQKKTSDKDWLYQNTVKYYKEVAKNFKLPISLEEHQELLKSCQDGVENLYNLLYDVGQITPKTRSEVDLNLAVEGILVRGSIDFFTPVGRDIFQVTDAKAYKRTDYLDYSQVELYCYILYKTTGINKFKDSGYLLFDNNVKSFFPVEIDLETIENRTNCMVKEYKEALNNPEDLKAKPEYVSCMLCGVYEHCKYKTKVSSKEHVEISLETTDSGTFTASFE